MTELTGGQAAVEALKAEQNALVFGLIGSATMELFDALYDTPEIEFIGVRDERTGTHMADAYARASGQAGVILAGQNGPGATNLLTGLAQAHAAYSPVVSVAGALSTEHRYRDAFQEVDQQSIFAPVTKKTWTVTSCARIPEMFREAFSVALSPRRGPVHLNLPRDVLSASSDFDGSSPPLARQAFARPAADGDSIEAAAKLLLGAKAPLILAGGGVKNTAAAPEVMALSEALNAPVVTSPGHGDAMPSDFRRYAGQAGPRGNPVASRLLKEADVILVLGSRLGFNTTFYSYDNLNQAASIIQVEIEPTAIGRYFPVSVGIFADVRSATTQLSEALAGASLKAEVSAWSDAAVAQRETYLQERAQGAALEASPLEPSGLFETLRQVLPRDTAITMDAGTLCLQATDALNFYQPKSLFTPLDFGLVGFSFAAGLGVKLAQKDRPVVSLIGDGGFGMTSSELSTAVDHNINTVTVVMNNGCWGAEKAYQRDFFGGRYIGADVSSPPYDKLAQLYGAEGYAVSRCADLADALHAALDANKPAVIDVKVDPNALYSFRRDSFKHRGG